MTDLTRPMSDESYFAWGVRVGLYNARTLHGKHASLHETYAVLLEELDELWDEVRKKRGERSAVKILSKLVQIGAMAQRAAEDLGYCAP